MSCYNSEEWVNNAISSVLNQTFEDFEFVIIDDGSTDNTLNIVKGFSYLDSRITIIEKNHTGLADSLNIGIFQSNGKWIARIDADDVCELNRIELQVAFVESNPEIVFLGSGCVEVSMVNTMQKINSYPESHHGLVKHLESSKKFPPHSSAFYSTNAVRLIGGYRKQFRMSQDRDLWLRLSEIGNLACINKPLVRIRNHEGQVSNSNNRVKQILYSRIATISYFIRIKGAQDPVDGNDSEYVFYKDWIEKQINVKKLSNIVNTRNIIMLALRSPINLSNLLQLVMKIFNGCPYLLHILIERYLGVNTPRILAKKWLLLNSDKNNV
jgi:glycosyltransferase involved in cell wall biosynthesis